MSSLRVYQLLKVPFEQQFISQLKNSGNLLRVFTLSPQKCWYSSKVTVNASPQKTEEKVSKAMTAYLERASEHDQFMQKEHHEYKIGKRHLANMMGEDPEMFTQKDIDNAIEYLFPSGLFDKKAKPLFKPPEEVFPQRKAAEFNETGRPHHTMFYTGKPNFFKTLYDIVENINVLNGIEDKMIRKQVTPDKNMQIDLNGTDWISKEQLEKMLVETIIDLEYDNFTSAMSRLVSHPYSYRVKSFIDQYRRPLMSQSSSYAVPQPQYDEEGRMFVTTYECLRKTARADVTVRSPGTGQLLINGIDITYLSSTQAREQVL